jgi:hypothetical protein
MSSRVRGEPSLVELWQLLLDGSSVERNAGGVPVSSVARSVRRLLTAAMCALATHAVLYRSFWPTEGVHGYLGWYEAFVGVLSAISALGVAAVVVRKALLCGEGRRVLAVPAGSSRSARGLAREIGASGLLVLVLQESVERAVESGQVTVAPFTPGQLLVVLAAVAAISSAIAFALSAGGALVRRIVAADRPPARTVAQTLSRWSVACSELRPPRTLAVGHALRGPPVSAG